MNYDDLQGVSFSDFVIWSCFPDRLEESNYFKKIRFEFKGMHSHCS